MTRLLMVLLLASTALGQSILLEPIACRICLPMKRPIFETLVAAKICRRCHTVDLTWQASVTPEVTSYAVYRNGVRIAQGAALSMTDDTVVSGKQYQYFVTALVSTSESDPSNTVTAVIP